MRAEIRGLQEWRRKSLQIAEDLHGREMLSKMELAVITIERSAKKNAPVDTGRLRNSITHEVRSAGGLNPRVEGVVGTVVHYAPYMEEGTGVFAGRSPHKVSTAFVEAWARRHGLNPFLVARAITLRGGLEPRNYLKDAVKENEKKVMEILDHAVKFIIRK